MKTKLLLVTFLLSNFCFSQAPINNYFGVAGNQFAIVTGTINQSASGANANWNFSSLTQTGTNTDSFSATDPDIGNYPGTTQVLTISDTAMNINKLFYNQTGATLSLTGASNSQFTLDYNTDNALIGTYPLTFGSTVTTDAIAGTITAQGQSASYTGTITNEVDAYGILNFDVLSQGTYSGSVTRIKTEQSINFSIFGFPGTASIINYNYYKDSDGALVFRTTDGLISVPFLGINQTINSIEALITNTLSISDLEVSSNLISIYPNPVGEYLNIRCDASMSIQSLKVIDMNGREVINIKTNNKTVNLQKLKAGFYFLNITTDKGLGTRKFIKK